MLDELNRKHKVKWIKVKGHSDNEYNNRCDRLAVLEIKQMNGKKDENDVQE
jgi:ribonuclease HI